MDDYYSLSQVEQMTGLKAATLRIWERRYGFIMPRRKSSGAREYNETEVKTLLNVRILISAGFRISQIVKLSPDEIFQEIDRIYESKDIESEVYIQSLIKVMLDLDEKAFDSIFNKVYKSNGLLFSMEKVFYPFLRRIGGLWLNDKIVPVNEHFISNLLRQKIISAIDKLETISSISKKVMLFVPEQEGHEIALLMAYYIFKQAGWQVLYFGIRVPIADLANVIRKEKCHYGFCFIQIPLAGLDKQLKELLTKHKKFNLFMAGNLAGLDTTLELPRCEPLANFDALLLKLDSIN